jgi:hypothetical protein
MPLTITLERYLDIRNKLKKRRTESLVAEIAATDWNNQAHFQNVDEFLRYADTFVVQSDTDPSRSRKRG